MISWIANRRLGNIRKTCCPDDSKTGYSVQVWLDYCALKEFRNFVINIPNDKRMGHALVYQMSFLGLLLSEMGRDNNWKIVLTVGPVFCETRLYNRDSPLRFVIYSLHVENSYSWYFFLVKELIVFCCWKSTDLFLLLFSAYSNEIVDF